MVSEILEKLDLLIKADMNLQECERVVVCFERLSELNSLELGNRYRQRLEAVLKNRSDLPVDEITAKLNRIYYDH